MHPDSSTNQIETLQSRPSSFSRSKKLPVCSPCVEGAGACGCAAEVTALELGPGAPRSLGPRGSPLRPAAVVSAPSRAPARPGTVSEAEARAGAGAARTVVAPAGASGRVPPAGEAASAEAHCEAQGPGGPECAVAANSGALVGRSMAHAPQRRAPPSLRRVQLAHAQLLAGPRPLIAPGLHSRTGRFWKQALQRSRSASLTRVQRGQAQVLAADDAEPPGTLPRLSMGEPDAASGAW